MTLSTEIYAELATGSPNRLQLPEHRQIEINTKRIGVEIAECIETLPIQPLAGVVRASLLLESFLLTKLGFVEPVESWPFYLGLPRETGVDKIIAQIYRILRVTRLILLHPMSRIELSDGLVKINGVIGPNALSIEISVAGLNLLESAVGYFMSSSSGPYPSAYVESMLGEYYVDILSTIKRYSDEGRSLYQFRHPVPFCRYFRFDCDKTKITQLDGEYEIEIGPLYKDKARFPIDFFVVVDKWLHIVPVEALKDNRISAVDLKKWRAVTTDGFSLPFNFKTRFCSDSVIVNQPMA